MGWWFTRSSPAIVWQGYAEADFVKIGPTQPGLLTAVYVQRGDEVPAGAPLFEQDDTYDQAAREQAAQQLAQAQNQLGNLLAGSKPTEIAQAQANLADANATLVRATTDLRRSEALLPSGAVTKQSVDQLQAEYLSAQAKVAAMQAALTQSQAPMGRDQEVARGSAQRCWRRRRHSRWWIGGSRNAMSPHPPPAAWPMSLPSPAKP